MRWLVYGAGAVGGVLAGRMHEAGLDVAVVARGAHLDAIQRDGLLLVTPEGERRVPVPAVGSAAELDRDSPTTVLLAVKSHQTLAAVEDLTRHLDPVTVVSVQNGVANEPTLLRFFADVQGVCVMMPTGHLEPGVVEQHCSPVPGVLDVGAFPSGSSRTTATVAQAFRSAGFVSEPRWDIMAWKRRKLVMNLANAVQACCGADDPDADELRRLVTDEGERVLAASGLPVVPVEQDRERRGDLLQVHTLPGRPRGGGSSWQSLRRAQGSIESDYLNGEIVLLGRLHGTAAPANDLVRRTAVRLAHEGAAPGAVSARELLDLLG
jgi:2-dehydropantoate 2-reductase